MLIAGSNVRFYWLKSGWIFRAGAIGYAALNVINSVSKKDFSWSKNKNALLISTGVFAEGMLLKKLYKPVLRLGGKYHIESLVLSDQ